MRKVAFAAELLAIGVYVLAEQGYFLHPARGKLAHFFEYHFGAAASLSSAYVRHDAVGTEVVAAVHNAHPCAEAAFAHNGKPLGYGKLAVVWHKNSLFLFIGTIEYFGQM